jgi:hypothetical protein
MLGHDVACTLSTVEIMGTKGVTFALQGPITGFLDSSTWSNSTILRTVLKI